MRTIHRITMMFAVIFVLYLGVTGSIIQGIDLQTLLSHAPASNPNMLSIREGIYGPSNFQVISTPDFTAASLPTQFDLEAGLGTVLKAARSAVGGAALDYIELRMAAGKPVGQVLSGGRVLRFDAASGAALPVPPPVSDAGGPRSPHDQIKSLHRMDKFGDWAVWLNGITGLAMFVLICSGLVLYFQMLSARARNGRSGLFWSAGGLWRSLHRALSLIAAVFLLVVSITGMLLAVDNIGVSFYLAARGESLPSPTSPTPGPPTMPSAASPLKDGELPMMLRTTLAATESAAPDAPLKVIRLRYFGTMAQGVVITGKRQLVFNAQTGQRALEYEPGYPKTGFIFGWEEHEIVKQIHRGDYFGLTGRWIDLLSGLSLVFLCVSGIVMYFETWLKRRNLGRPGIFWG